MWNYWIIGVIILILIALYVASDASQFGESGLLWGLVVLFMPMMGLILYLVLRSTWTRPIERPQKFNTGTSTRVRTVPPHREQIQTIYPVENDTSKTGGIGDNFKDKQFCTSCGTENSRNAVYCNSCGARIELV